MARLQWGRGEADAGVAGGHLPSSDVQSSPSLLIDRHDV